MSSELIEILISEFREEFQIPPFFADSGIKNYLLEGLAELTNLKFDVDVENDLIARSLLKNYCNYAYFKKLDEFWINYGSSILRWQMGDFNEEVGDDDESTDL